MFCSRAGALRALRRRNSRTVIRGRGGVRVGGARVLIPDDLPT